MGFYDAIRVGASGAADSAFTVDRSLRFNDDDSAKLNRTFGTNSSNTTKTLSFWMKRGNLGSYQTIFGTTSAGFIESRLQFTNTDELQFVDRDSSSGVTDVNKVTTRKFKDIGAWYHIVFALNSTDGTADDRVKIYVNGVRETSFSTSTNPSSSYSFSFYRSSVDNFIGANNTSDFFDGYMAEVNFIDGQALTPSSFGETDATTGQWNPIDTSGLTFGTNGFRLKFADNSGTTATTLGKDSSGNGNNFTPNNFSVAAGAGNDSLEDTPTNNFATMNPLANEFPASTFSEGNLSVAMASSKRTFNTSTFGVKTGKWYFEMKPTATGSGSDNCVVGIVSRSDSTGTDDQLGASTSVVFRNNGNIKKDGSNATHGASWTTSNIVMVAIDADNNNVYFGVDGQWADGSGNNDEANPTSAVSFTSTMISDGVIFAAFGDLSLNDPNPSGSFNFGQQAFSYTPPTGYKKINSANLPDPTILLPNKHFNTTLYTGNNSSQEISTLNFQPDWLWFKSRSSTSFHVLFDNVRGRAAGLASNVSNDEYTSNADKDLVSFDDDGFTLGSTQGWGSVNGSGNSIVAWAWNAGDTDGKTYTVKVVSDSGNKYRFDDFGTSAVTLDLAEGGTYIFDGADSSMASHPIKLSETSNGTHGGGSSYNTGVTYLLDGASVTESAYVSGYSSATTRQLKIVVAASAPTLYYYCHYHSGMGGQANTNSTLGSSNFDGSIQSTVKVNASAGFSIVTYTGNGTEGATLGHGLSVTPQVTIIKDRTTDSRDFIVNHPNLTSGKVLFLNSTSAELTNGGGTPTTFTSTTIRLDSGSGGLLGINHSSDNYVMYCLSEVSSYSKFGSYVGNGSSDGVFVFTGFKPAWVLVKNVSSSYSWDLNDNKRDPDNVCEKVLSPNLSDAEATATSMDFLSNGFKLRVNNNSQNRNGDTFIYLAFAESPFKNARAR